MKKLKILNKNYYSKKWKDQRKLKKKKKKRKKNVKKNMMKINFWKKKLMKLFLKMYNKKKIY